jgi:hypothetical protein
MPTLAAALAMSGLCLKPGNSAHKEFLSTLIFDICAPSFSGGFRLGRTRYTRLYPEMPRAVRDARRVVIVVNVVSLFCRVVGADEVSVIVSPPGR